MKVHSIRFNAIKRGALSSVTISGAEGEGVAPREILILVKKGPDGVSAEEVELRQARDVSGPERFDGHYLVTLAPFEVAQ